MKGSIIWKLVITACIVAWAVLNLVPVQDTPFEEFIETRPTANVSEFNALLERARERVADKKAPSLFIAIRDIAQEEQIDLYGTYFQDINLIDVKNLQKRNNILMDVLLQESQGKLKKGLDLQGGVAVTFRINEDATNPGEAESRLEDAVDIMSERVNGLGVAEPIIRPVPPNGIEIQLPGINLEDNPDIIKNFQRPARLEFRKVHTFQRPGPTDRPGDIKSLSVNPMDPNSPVAAYEVMILEEEDRDTGEIEETRYFVKKIPEATGSIIDSSFPTLGPTGQWAISVDMTSDGGDVFADITREMHASDQQLQQYGVRALLASVLDGKLYSAVGLSEGPILNGSAQITGNFSQREAVELSNVLNNPLEYELVLDEMYEVGPSLAEDARDASINAAIWGSSAVIVFMLIYYVFAGLVAVLSVILNLLIVLGILASVGATLTLPGVAALVLTIGMAVDANILIFERIREELRTGKSARNALQSGYEKALSTIVDANVTTMITALILIIFGREAVKGFGVTLAIGIGSSVFAALIISRCLLEIIVSIGAKKLLPFTLFKPTKIQFLKFRVPAFVTSWIIVLIGIGAIVTHSGSILGKDFKGGAEVKLEFNQDAKDQLSISRILEVADENDLGEVQPVFQKLIGDNKERLSIQMDLEKDRSDQVVEVMKAAFPDAELKVVETSIIGASVSKAVQLNALKSVVIALIAILLYVAIRFEVGYGVGAVVATVHDVLMSIGIYVILGQVLGIGAGQFSAPMVAAILMILGYSINDTIVVFDRIREELELNPEMKLFDVVNLAINRTLSRTLLTSVTTLVAATSLWVFGEGIVTDFALIFIIGILTGTFSSIFIASPVFYAWHKGNRKSVTEGETKRPTYEWESTSQKARKPVKS
ncbi:protein translocase subunit SecD [Rubellicoccus peritrichatus]|uniref:Multifunctional fusion protein n=1 Tax=Rubellicoccus peritrichatus TaxID=3080537 RepID=A0AAQ3L9C5_9BACT|nr:protein translocase subunit SecD [Puniceicoccus sp. CR14]WOO40102.1 protein translocase subunit SecD [Puniceicoccus sp. CR14]